MRLAVCSVNGIAILPSSNRTPEPPEKASLAHTAANDRSLDSATFLGLVAGGDCVLMLAREIRAPSIMQE
jgi:hypothetical protein